MHPDALYQFAVQRHADDIDRAARTRRAKAARRADDRGEPERAVPAPRPKFA